MEITLVYNQPLELSEYKGYYDFCPDGGQVVTTMARQTGEVRIPITAKLVEDLKTLGIPHKFTIGQTVVGPKISVGFKKLDVQTESHEGYLDVRGLHLLGRFFSNEARLKNNFKLRLDIESVKEESKNFNLRPGKPTQVFILGQDWERVLSKSIMFLSTKADENLLRYWPRPNSGWSTTVSLSLVICPKTGPYEGIGDHLAIYGKMKNDEIFSDITIIAQDNVEIKCHKSVLATQSTVFAVMFETQMKEAESGVVDLSGMSEEGVRAMLDFLYVWKSVEAEENPLVCVELLEAGDRYNIESLENCMEEILLEKDFDWFTPEATLRLVLYLKDMDWLYKGFDGRLKEKAIKVYKSKFAEVQELPAYEELFKEKPEVLKTLVEYLSSY